MCCCVLKRATKKWALLLWFLKPQIIKHRWSDWDVTSLGVYFCLGSKRVFAQLSPAIQHAQFICKQIQQSDSVSSLIICVLLSVLLTISIFFCFVSSSSGIPKFLFKVFSSSLIDWMKQIFVFSYYFSHNRTGSYRFCTHLNIKISPLTILNSRSKIIL